VGDPEHLPECEIDLPSGYTLERLTTSGDVVDEILRVSEERDVDLIAMATLGRSGFLDALRGSTTEQVIRQTRCPVLAVPAIG
jgi:nucleotide-binding universal stress UspA family protein